MTEAFPGHMPKSSDAVSTQPGEPLPSSSARFGAFTDAVVAIAMTLLILPVTEAIPEASTKHLGTVVFLREHQLQLLSFALSFVLIGMFWLLHHRIFRADTPHSFAMSAVNFGWMFHHRVSACPDRDGRRARSRPASIRVVYRHNAGQ